MFKFNNPDALLVLLLTAATYCTLRGVENGRIRWIVWAGVAVGFAFLTKQLQAFLIVPVLGGVYLFASPRRLGTRVLHLLAGLGALVVSAGWWVAIVELVPASRRPYIGGSQTNDFLELTFGYNGFGRLTGNETGSVTPGGNGGAGAWGQTGITRLFGTEFGGQISWLLPAALVLLVASLVLLRRRPRIDPARATVLLLGGTLLVTGAALSFGAGIIHPYYSVALAPAIGGLVGVGAALLWQHRATPGGRITAAAVVLLSGAWSWFLLAEAPTYLPWLKVVVALAAVVAAAALLLPVRTFAAVGLTAALVTGLAGPAAFAVTTTATAHTGSIPSAGPAVAGARGGFGGRPGFANGQPPQGFGQHRFQGGFPGGAPGKTGTQNGFGGFQGRGGFGGAGRAGGLLGGDTAVSSSIRSLLRADASKYTWAAAAVGSQTAASYQLASGEAVMPVGGFNGSDPSPTLAEFQRLVKEGRIHYFIASGRGFGGSNGGSNASGSIASWVQANFAARTVGGVTLYDLTSGSGATASDGASSSQA
jgi:4-amino-4-deoxy-L-arabinose transferase-like glycosyltransferase